MNHMFSNPIKRWLGLLIAGLVILNAIFLEAGCSIHYEFNEKRAFEDVKTQLAYGARTPGSIAHQVTGDWILEELVATGWQVDEQSAIIGDHPIRNLIGRRGSGSSWIILGAHYDSRLVADRDVDPEAQLLPVPGANDGASGVAVLLELARSLPRNLNGEIWLVFFDAEDQGGIPGWDWILGSTYFAEQLEELPDCVVVVDMIGDFDLEIFKERRSDQVLTAEIWQAAGEVGQTASFNPDIKYQMIDDHLPFLELGIPAAVLIDFDYPFYHTADDTLNKITTDSLKAVGTTIHHWLIGRLSN